MMSVEERLARMGTGASRAELEHFENWLFMHGYDVQEVFSGDVRVFDVLMQRCWNA